tara:strand:- start:269 stop:541 length:273 start_codon:yes stop_codon:yes gene_type:complete
MFTGTTILGIIATGIVSHFGGEIAGSVLIKMGWLGFGRKVGIASNILKVGKAVRAVYDKSPTDKSAKADLKRWLSDHDPENVSKLGNGIQ